MKPFFVALAVVAALLMSVPAAHADVRCEAYTPECGFPSAPEPSTAPVPVPELPHKCWKKTYRMHHKHKCHNYAHWKSLVGDAR